VRSWQATIVAIIVVAIVITAVYAVYYSSPTGGEKKIVIYTYESLLGWGDNPNQTWDKVFGEFERTTGIKVEVVKFDDAGVALTKVIEEAKSGRHYADIIIGIDNILVAKAKKSGILEKYTPNNINEINKKLIDALDPEGYVIPYDYGLIALVYDTKYIPPYAMENLTFQDLLTRTVNLNGKQVKLIDTLVTEDPRKSSTGLGFLLWEIAVYNHYNIGDWRDWWKEGNPTVVASWGDAYDLFDKGKYHIVVSYGTDPAYSMYFYNTTRYKAAVVVYEGKPVAWLQIEGIALLKDAPHKEYAEKFIDWFLSKQVQDLIPLNNWMYPANINAKLPDVYKYAIDPSDVELANLYFSDGEVQQNLEQWLNQWFETISTKG
jgi:thiamine transport system substrate-binding protein